MRAFDSCDALTTVTLSGSLEKLNKGTFSFCKNLQKVVINSKLQSIGDNYFGSCAVSEIFFIGSIEEWQSIEKGSNWISSSEYVVYCSDGTLSGDGTIVYYAAE